METKQSHMTGYYIENPKDSTTSKRIKYLGIHLTKSERPKYSEN